jgi:adenine-specific DNA-methyltransferase
MSLLHLESFPAQRAGWILSYFLDQVSGRASVANRRFVLVQLPEPLNSSDKDQETACEFCAENGLPPNIASLTKERLRRAAAKLRGEYPSIASDVGFRVFKLDSSNIREWNASHDHLNETLLENVEHLMSDRAEQDILCELLLKRGLDLCVPIETKSIADKEVYSVGAGTLIVCLADEIGRDVGEALALGIAQWHKELDPAGDTAVVFRDDAFADDVVKTNVAAILDQHGLKNVRSL